MSELVFDATFFKDCLPQAKLLKDMEWDVKSEWMNWVGDEKAKILFSKVPDILVYDKNESGINFSASRKLHKLINDQDLLNSVFYLTEKKLSVNNFNINKAVAFWVINWFENQPFIEPVFQEQIIDFAKIGNVFTWIRFRSNFFNQKFGSYWLDWIFTFGKFGREVTIGIFDKYGKLANEWSQWKWFLDQFPVDEKTRSFLKSQFDIFDNENRLYLKDELPFVAVKNNPAMLGDYFYIKTDIEEMMAVKSQKLLEIFMGSTKMVVNKDTFNSNLKKRNELIEDRKELFLQAFSPVISVEMSNSGFGTGIPNVGVNYGQPVAEPFERIEKAIKNRMLQKVGAATDVDSKGTVQQTQSELVMIQGGQFRSARWKKNDRQKCLTDLFTKIAKIYQSQGDEDFVNFDKIQVIISQDEVISETNMLENLRLAEEQGLTSKLINFARYNKLSIVDAEMILKKGGLDMRKNNSEMVKSDYEPRRQ